ncbi:MAG: hypothetical protein ACHQY1_06930 [Myxococcota bacterium]|jgi:hypothetical protein
MPEPRDRPDLPPEPWSKETAEDTEPDWAQSIRNGRKARGDRLRSVFAGFDDADDDPTSAVPSRSPVPRDDRDQGAEP